MRIERFICRYLCSNCYLVTENGHAFIIDPCGPEQLEAPLSAVTPDFVLLTHEHCDHISGVSWAQDTLRLPVICSESCAVNMQDPRMNYSFYYETTKKLMGYLGTDESIQMEPFVSRADITFSHDMEKVWQGHRIRARLTPGHSIGSVSYLMDDRILFVGDTIFQNAPTITRFKTGSRTAFETVTKPWLRQLPPDTQVYPGHFDPFLLKDWSELKKE